MSQAYRLASAGQVDRSRLLQFTFDGRRLTGYAGDTVASALLANGVHQFGRSFKYHRPRGILGAGVEEPNALVEIDRGPGRREPNLQATLVELTDGLVVRSQNRWPTLGFDLGALSGALAPLIPAGFYYKTFMWPPKAWTAIYEPLIRRAAGLGRAPDQPDPDVYDTRFDHCEILVVGGGPAGLAAALSASESGQRVILCDESHRLGGSLLSDPSAEIEGQAALAWVRSAQETLERRQNVMVLPRTTAFHYGAHNMVGLLERLADHRPVKGEGGPRQRWRQVRAGRVILAAGAHERPLLFSGNDRPGVMLASAAQAYIHRFAVAPGRTAVVLSNADSGLFAALDVAEAGVSTTILDLRESVPAGVAARFEAAGVAFFTGVKPLKAKGANRVTGLLALGPWRGAKLFPCDLLLMAGGWTPAIHLFSQSRGQVLWNEAIQAYVPGAAAQAVRCVGAGRGVFSLKEALDDGSRSGRWAADLDDAARQYEVATDRTIRPASPIPVGAESKMAFVDYQNDVTVKDVQLALREGFQSVEHLKRYTTTGMATDQGRTSNVNAMAVAAAAAGIATGDVGVTTFRPPYTPITFGALANFNRGRTFEPVRTTPLHGQALARGAVFENYGRWVRARFFPKDGEGMDAAVRRECATVRRIAGLFDASTLGKIEVVGPDAHRFLGRIYATELGDLQVGRSRYGLMLREDGFIFDDGIVARLATDRFLITTSTSHAEAVLHHLEDYLQTEWPELVVWLTGVTEQWATIAVQGPESRRIIAPLIEGVDLAPRAFPRMAVAACSLAGVPIRLFRLSFSGELGFEISVPASQAPDVWTLLEAEAAKVGAGPYGVEAMLTLRAEMGHLIIGQETDGTTLPDDVGQGQACARKQGDFVGRRSLRRAAAQSAKRTQLVGLRPEGHETLAEEGAQLVGLESRSGEPQGHVTSSYWSEVVAGPIALALLEDGRARHGEVLGVTRRRGGPSRWKVQAPLFRTPNGIDPDA